MLLAGAGDLVVMRRLRHARRPPAGSLLRLLAAADLAVANLEVPLTAIDDPQKEGLTLRGEPELLADVAATGVDAVCLANNHAADQGWPALRELAERCRAAGIEPLGVGADPDSAFAPSLRLAGGLRVGLVAATCVSMERFMAAPGRPGMAGIRCRTEFDVDAARVAWEPGFPARARTSADQEDVDRLLRSVVRAREAADLVVVAMHWGVSHQQAAADYQRELARALVGAGAGVVFGCHAHDLQGVEVIAGSPVFYGLGSLVFGYQGAGAGSFPRDSAVALVEVSAAGAVESARLVLGRLDPAGEPLRAGPQRAGHMAEAPRRWSDGWGAGMRLKGDTLDIRLAEGGRPQ